jgi:O-antigen ligase
MHKAVDELPAETARRELGAALPGLAAVLLFLLLALGGGGFRPTIWYPAGLFLLVLLALVLVTGAAVRPPRMTLVALGAFAAFTIWCFASISWSEVRGDALDGSNQTLLYFAAFALFALMPVPRGFVVVMLGLYATGVAFVALATVARAQGADDPASFFIDGRLASPLGYPNAAAALFLAAYWPAVTLAARRGAPPLLRGVFLGAATALLGTAVLCQSRGSVLVFPFMCLVHLVLVPGRARSVVSLALTGGAVAAVLPILLDVYPMLDSETVPDRLSRPLVALVVVTAVTACAGWLVALLDVRVNTTPTTDRRIATVVLSLTAVAAVAVGGWAAVTFGSPVHKVAVAWEDFKAGADPPSGVSHLTSGLGSNRYDFWRVALGNFADRPLTGAGVENFSVEYIRERRSNEEPLYPHSLEVRVLAQTGVPGAAMFLLFLGSAILALHRARARDSLERAALLGGLTATTYWLVHGSVDWLWEFPALTLPALAWLALGGNAVATGSVGRALRPPIYARLAIIAGTAGAVVVLALPWIAVQETSAAASGWRADPNRALARLDRARRLNPLSAQPDIVAGVIAGRRGDVAGMLLAYERALERNPANWFAQLELGLALAAAGQRGPAIASVRRARALNPREPVLRDVARALTAGRRVDRRRIERLFASRAATLSR